MKIDTSGEPADPTFRGGHKDGLAGYWPLVNVPAIYHEGYRYGAELRRLRDKVASCDTTTSPPAGV